jgi:hypothetical protein
MPHLAPNAEDLDQHLLDVVRALHGAVRQGVSRADDAKVIERAIQDCKEILDVIMAGNVNEWLN